jgi:hypothetical protein
LVKNIKNNAINNSNGLESWKTAWNRVRSSSWIELEVLEVESMVKSMKGEFPWWNLLKNHKKLIKNNKIMLKNSPWGCNCNEGRWRCWRGERSHENLREKSLFLPL